jgi:rSAM/selenodomain-associated transferase 1
MTKQVLIVFAKYPEPGLVKTRLAAEIGRDEAARVYRSCAERVIAAVAPATAGYDVELACSPPGDKARMVRWLGPGMKISGQQGYDLGSRMHNAFVQGFAAGYERVIIIGTDCPALTRDNMEHAFRALHSADAVIGPAADGGYYLIGLTRPVSGLFIDVSWGTERVLSQTIKKCHDVSINAALLPELRDIDRVDDLSFYRSQGLVL